MEPTLDSSPEDAKGKQSKAVRDLRFLAAALRGSADRMAPGLEGDKEILEIVGWTIYVASEDNLLDSATELQQCVKPEVLQAMRLGIPKLVREESASAGPVIMPDAGKTIEQFIEQLSAVENNPAAPAEQTASTVPPVLTFDPDEAAVYLVAEVWEFVAFKYRDQLPDDIANGQVGNPFIGHFWLESRAGFNAIAFLCDLLAKKIAAQVVGESDGWVTVTDAATLTGFNGGLLSRNCSDGSIQSNGESGPGRRLELRSLVKFARKKRAKLKDEVQSDVEPGWVCTSCGESYLERVESCVKCHRWTIVRGKRPV